MKFSPLLQGDYEAALTIYDTHVSVSSLLTNK